MACKQLWIAEDADGTFVAATPDFRTVVALRPEPTTRRVPTGRRVARLALGTAGFIVVVVAVLMVAYVVSSRLLPGDGGGGRTDDPSVLDGVYRLEWTLDQLVAAGVPQETVRQFDMAGIFTWTLNDGALQFTSEFPDGTTIDCGGTYEITADMVDLRLRRPCPEWLFTANWELTATSLVFTDPLLGGESTASLNVWLAERPWIRMLSSEAGEGAVAAGDRAWRSGRRCRRRRASHPGAWPSTGRQFRFRAPRGNTGRICVGCRQRPTPRVDRDTPHSRAECPHEWRARCGGSYELASAGITRWVALAVVRHAGGRIDTSDCRRVLKMVLALTLNRPASLPDDQPAPERSTASAVCCASTPVRRRRVLARRRCADTIIRLMSNSAASSLMVCRLRRRPRSRRLGPASGSRAS